MTDDFRDEFSEDDLARLTGDGDPAVARFRALQRAVWEYFEDGLPVGDGRQIGLVVICEIEARDGRAIRFHVSDQDGNSLPSWQTRGYLPDFLSVVDTMSPSKVQRPRDFVDDDEE